MPLQKSIRLIMNPTVNPDNVKNFFWDHLNKDLNLIGKTLNLNMDEVFIILHFIFNDIMTSVKSSRNDKWNSKNDRQNWENEFSDTFLTPVFRVGFFFVCLTYQLKLITIRQVFLLYDCTLFSKYFRSISI